MSKEAKARIKINKLLEEAGWRLLDDKNGAANVVLENNTKINKEYLDDLGQPQTETVTGFLDYLLLDNNGFPFIVLEAKKEGIHPLSAKEQTRQYALSQNCRFIILSNASLHYFWDLKKGNPNQITKFPSPETANAYTAYNPTPDNLINEEVLADYIVKTQKPDYDKDPRYINEKERQEYLEDNKLKFLRKYQVRAIQRIQEEVKKGKDRFLFEMATGTGKTLTSAAVIKLFLRTGNARRVLFLVDRLELEEQANKAFKAYLKNDYTSVIFKENRDNWRKAEIVVSTVQSFLFKNKYKRIFTPTDFDLVISDEAHRSIGGNSRAVFEYFIGYKLGLTATPKDYLKKVDKSALGENDPRELERRMLLDTYITFGCNDGRPTYQYSLLHGVRDGFLVNPTVADARTDITTQMLSDQGYVITTKDEDGNEEEAAYSVRDFERKFYSEKTNEIFFRTFLEHALRDPVSKEIGKTLVFCVSQNHAAKVANMLNLLADKMFPGKYESDFAVQVTSNVTDAQQFTINFTNNRLRGSGNFLDLYKTSKARVCVTVGMMTTGYDCQDILNICLMRPIFSPSDFVQIKGRGTRKWNFADKEVLRDKSLIETFTKEDLDKKRFKLFDFFANCEYFEEKFNYDEVLKLPSIKDKPEGKEPRPYVNDEFESNKHDPLASLVVADVGMEGMKIDRMYFEKFEEDVKNNETVQQLMQQQNMDAVEQYIANEIFNKPNEHYNLDKLGNAMKVDRPLSIREIVEKIFGFIPYFKNKEELLEDEFEQFDSRYLPEEEYFNHAKNYFKSYITDPEFRDIIENRKYALLNTNPNGEVFRKLPAELRTLIPQYIKDNVALNKFTA